MISISLKKSFLVLLPIVFGFMLAGCGGLSAKGGAVSPKTVQVDFTPFEVDTFAPLKRETIGLGGSCHWRMDGADLEVLLDDMWSRAKPGAVDERVIRLKVDFGGADTVFVDRDGGVAWLSRNAQRSFEASDLQVLAVEMRKIARAHGCKHV